MPSDAGVRRRTPLRVARTASVFVAVFAILAILAMKSGSVDGDLPPDATADRVLVLKGERKLILFSGETVLKEYRIALGRDPVGPKREEGDGKTPEGSYVIDDRKEDSAFHRALHVSYPGAEDRAQAAARDVAPGGLIMIHGIRNGLGFVGRFHRRVDWTNGCIAVTNDEIEEIWRAVPDGTSIEIRP